MKIAVIGYSGSGKSTLAKELGSFYGVPVLFMDKICNDKKWKALPLKDRIDALDEFLKNNDSWIIDGNYNRVNYWERMQLADKIIFLDFNRFDCYKSAKARAKTYSSSSRESAPEGAVDRFNLSFKLWILFTGRTRKYKKTYKQTVEDYKDKVVILKNRQDIDKFVKSLRK
jgi:adenylate kinase family enzyme